MPDIDGQTPQTFDKAKPVKSYNEEMLKQDYTVCNISKLPFISLMIF